MDSVKTFFESLKDKASFNTLLSACVGMVGILGAVGIITNLPTAAFIGVVVFLLSAFLDIDLCKILGDLLTSYAKKDKTDADADSVSE